MTVVPREIRLLIPIEVLVVGVLAVAPLPASLPIALPLLVAATLSRAVRGRGWRELAIRPRTLLGGALAGLVAVAIAVPLFGAFRVTAVEWWLVPAVRGEPAQLAFALGHAVVTAIAIELALRGWILERAWELSPGAPALPIAAAALAEALLLGGPIPARIGAALFGAGLGLLYVAAGRSVLAPIAARATFAAGAIVAELLRA